MKGTVTALPGWPEIELVCSRHMTWVRPVTCEGTFDADPKPVGEMVAIIVQQEDGIVCVWVHADLEPLQTGEILVRHESVNPKLNGVHILQIGSL